MTARAQPPIINIGLVGGGPLCLELLEKTRFNYHAAGVQTPILAVADPEDDAQGKRMADEMGLLTFSDYHDLYDRRYNIHLIIVLTPDANILEDILNTRPQRIRILSYHVFKIFWETIAQEERKLREQKTAMETILNGIQDFILVITPEMEIVEANEAFFEKMDFTREEVIGKTCHGILENRDHPCPPPLFECPLKRVVRDKRQACQVRTRTDKHGDQRHFEVNVYPVWEKDGKISKFIHISRDITQRVKAEEEITRRLEQMVQDRTRELKQTHEQLLHQDKMASLGKLSASVVHEINNPIAGILNLIMLMKRVMAEEKIPEAEALKPFHGYMDLMETETRRISRIVSNLLAFSRQSPLAMRTLNVNRLIERTLILNANLLKLNKVKVETTPFGEIPDIMGSEDQLQQVFMNLVSNAAEAMEGNRGGRLVIRTTHRPETAQVLVAFSDTGPGIPPEHRQRLFEPFFTTKKKGKGVGLGLSVAYGIIQEHHGQITVDSSPDGAIFTVSLPVEGKWEPPVF